MMTGEIGVQRSGVGGEKKTDVKEKLIGSSERKALRFFSYVKRFTRVPSKRGNRQLRDSMLDARRIGDLSNYL